MEEEEEQKEGEEKPEVTKLEFWIVGLKVVLLVYLNIVVAYLFSGWEEKEENNKNREVLGLGINQWNKTNMG